MGAGKKAEGSHDKHYKSAEKNVPHKDSRHEYHHKHVHHHHHKHVHHHEKSEVKGKSEVFEDALVQELELMDPTSKKKLHAKKEAIKAAGKAKKAQKEYKSHEAKADAAVAKLKAAPKKKSLLQKAKAE